MSVVNSAEVMLAPEPASVGRARRWLSKKLEEWGLEDLDYDMSVVLSELVTNAILHARTPVMLRLVRGETVRIEVTDSSPLLPSLRSHGVRNTTGRGLHLVAALSNSWGSEVTAAGKVVWAEFPDVSGAEAEGEERAGGQSSRRSLRSLKAPGSGRGRSQLRRSA